MSKIQRLLISVPSKIKVKYKNKAENFKISKLLLSIRCTMYPILCVHFIPFLFSRKLIQKIQSK